MFDLGCGAGIDVLLAAREVGPGGKVVGIDFSSDMIEQARRAVVDAGLEGADIQLIVGNIEETGLSDDMADAVISNCVINLCTDKAAIYRESFRILKPGGRIAVSDILLSEHLAPDIEDTLHSNWSGCLGGAAMEDDYWSIIKSAGFTELSIVSRHVLSPDELFVISCCPGEDFSNPPPPEMLSAAQGKAESVKFRAQKPLV